MTPICDRWAVLATIGLVALFILLVGCSGPEERKAKYRLKAQEYMHAGNFPKPAWRYGTS